MQKYAQLTEHKRYQIYILKKAEHTQAYIAKMWLAYLPQQSAENSSEIQVSAAIVPNKLK